MYRVVAAFGIRASKWHGLHPRICSVALRSASSNVPGSLASDMAIPCFNELHANPLPLSEHVDTRVKALRDGGNVSSESGLSFPRTTIDLEARGFAILGGSTAKIPERKTNVFQRSFSSGGKKSSVSDGKKSSVSDGKKSSVSSEEKVPVVRHMIFYDEYELKKAKLVPLREVSFDGMIVKHIGPVRLLRKSQLEIYGRHILGDVGFPLLRQLPALVTINLMRGINISELIVLDNILWCPLVQGIVLADTSMKSNSLEGPCPYNLVRKVFNACVELSTGTKAERIRFAEELDDYLDCLKEARVTDKRIITNHSATRNSGERIHRNSRLNQVLRQDIPKSVLVASGDDEDLRQRSSRAANVFSDIARVFPCDLFLAGGLHRMLDCWARYSQRLRGFNSQLSPICLPNSPFSKLRAGQMTDGKELLEALEQSPGVATELGRILVGLHRDPFEHLYQPIFEKECNQLTASNSVGLSVSR